MNENNKISLSDIMNINGLEINLKEKLSENQLNEFHQYVSKLFFKQEYNILAIFKKIEEYLTSGYVKKEDKNLVYEILNDYIVQVFNDSKDLDEKNKEVIFYSIAIFGKEVFKNSDLFNLIKDDTPFLKNKLMVIDILNLIHHMYFVEMAKNERDGEVASENNTFKLIKNILENFFKANPEEETKVFITSFLDKTTDLTKYLGKEIFKDDFIEVRPFVLQKLADVLNHYLNDEDKYNFINFNQALFYKKIDSETSDWSIHINKEKMAVYLGVNEKTWDRSFWRRFTGDTFGLGEIYFDNNKFVRYSAKEDDEFIKIRFSSKMELKKQSEYIAVITKNIIDSLVFRIQEEIKEPFHIMKKKENILLKTKLSEEIIHSMHDSIRQITLAEEIRVIHKNGNNERKKNKI